MKRITAILAGIILFDFFNPANAQEKAVKPAGKHTVSGTIKEDRSGEVLIGASAYLLELPKTGTLSNAYGFYSITAPPGDLYPGNKFCRV
ncbi:MAG: hypothetical protein WDO19_06925 [Bacteroidota bacterium]